MAGARTTPDLALAAALEQARGEGYAVQRLLVSFSGGADSSALLAAAATVAATTGLALEAIHFDHDWHPASAGWAAHCLDTAASLGVPCRVEKFVQPRRPGASLEALGRELRYAALAARARHGTAVLTAHHAEDVAETFLLMALRGSGPHGLAAIAPSRPLGEGCLLRPFLTLVKVDLQTYAEASGLRALADPSNADEAFDRNYLRHQVLPVLRTRWPAGAATLTRAARLQQEAVAALDEAADLALGAAGASEGRLPLSIRAAVSPRLWRWCVRRWLVKAGMRLPGARNIDRVCDELVHAAADRIPVVSWPGAAVRRYDQALWITPERVAPLRGEWTWAPAEPLRLPGGWLRAESRTGAGIAVKALAGLPLRVVPRHGGERLQLPGREHHHRVKHLWQTARVPPWERAGTPLVYLGDMLAAVPGIGTDAAFAASAAEPGLVIHWLPDPAAEACHAPR